MIARILLAIFVLFFSLQTRAEWDVSGGMESYQWKEYPGQNRIPTEAGPRLALFANWTQEKPAGLLVGGRSKFYGGTIGYDSYDIVSGAPVSTQTEYSGIALEGLLLFRHRMKTYNADLLLGLGQDAWRRNIGGGSVQQIEDYTILFARAGIRMHRGPKSSGFQGEFGIKFPVSCRENAHLTDMGYTSNPKLAPKGAISAYAEFGYRVNAKFGVMAYYDSWRFKRSDSVIVTDTSNTMWLINQPESRMDALGFRLQALF